MKFHLEIHDNDTVINSQILIKKIIYIDSHYKMLNCFKTEKNGIIICFCDYYKNNENYYYIAAYNQDLEYLCNYTQKINIYKDIP